MTPWMRDGVGGDEVGGQEYPPTGNAPPPFGENDKWETGTSKTSVAFHEDDLPSLCNKTKGKLSSAKESSAETSTNKKNKPLAATTLKAFQDDFPSLSNVSEKVMFDASSGDNASEKKSKKKTEGSTKWKSLLEDDLTELPAQTKKTKPPPGFQMAQVVSPPPGLGIQPSALGRRCSPGFNSAPSTMPFSALAADASSGDNVSEKTKKITEESKKWKSLLEDDFPELPAQTKKTKPPQGFQMAQVVPPPTGLGTQPSVLGGRCPPGFNSAPSTMTFSALGAAAIPKSLLNLQTYVLLQNDKQRNSALVSHVQHLLILEVDGFDRFCALSREFRLGQISADKYHKACEDLFGTQKLLEILPELVALLPDIVKQHELAEAHWQSILVMCAPLNLMTCPTCHQYLKVEDSTVHFSSHVK
ncbi:hypothetical protein ACOMHN_010943 [Nucella lapillus]